MIPVFRGGKLDFSATVAAVMSPSDRTDYSGIISQASAAVDKQEKIRQERASRRQRKLVPLIVSALSLLIVAYAGSTVWGRLAPPSEAQVAQDLEKTVAQAKQIIDASRKETGQLPETLPAAMASVVRYDKADTAYTLSATVLGVRVTMKSDGMMSTDRGVKE